ncbi:hypothetical protein UFOVP1466_48 [uncultured Caudovirales phage]|uniref:Uncharacterized protein n=2 Tax=uncultured Caudovirales phage TaxID=2100421 RepID=A0A6J5SIX5_9CAUD|nr:hypothetical protein UFOVP1466_48 [uncultured Caudovirales phage]
MAEFNMDGLLGNLFGGGGDSELEKLLTAKQKEQLGLQSTLSAAAALLQASGRSPQRIGLGQALGSALQAGQGAYEKGLTGAFSNLVTAAKLKEMQQEAAANEAYRKQFTGDQVTPLTSAQAALAAPVSVAGPAGPTMARAQLAEQMPAPTAAAGSIVGSLNPEMRRILGGMTRKEGQPELLKIGMAQTEFGKPEPMVVNGQVKMMQFNKLGQSREYTGATPYEAQSPDLRAYEYISGTSLAGTGPKGIENVGKYRSQIAPKTQVDVKLPGNQQFLAGVGTDVSKTLNELTMGARSANETLINIDRILPALDKAIVGPGADYRTAMLRIGQQLNVAGANANEQLANTRVVLQGLAQQELDAAGQMRGQGSIIGSERELLKRAASGDQTLSAAEITTALNTAQKVARYRLKLQEDYLQSASKLPGFEQFAPMYKVTPYSSGGGGGNPLLNAIDQQLQINSGVKK